MTTFNQLRGACCLESKIMYRSFRYTVHVQYMIDLKIPITYCYIAFTTIIVEIADILSIGYILYVKFATFQIQTALKHS